ncbi:MAG: DUF4329 domain-containing protein [Polyangiaceae bacterium]
MNGRIYDPAVGRFLSPDPTVQFASNLQSYKHYSYAADNPLRYTDPTGYNYWEDGLGGLFNFGTGAVALVACAGSGGAACGMAVALVVATINTTAAVSSGQSWDSAIASAAVSLGASYLAGAVGGLAGGGILGGAIGGAATAAFMTPLSGGDLGENMLIGATRAALYATMGAATQSENEVSQADEEQERPVPRDGAGAPNPSPGPGSEGGRPNWKQILKTLHWQKSEALAAYIFEDAADPPSIKYNREVYTLIVRQDGKFAYLPAQIGSANASDGFWDYYRDFVDRAPTDVQVEGWAHTHGIYDGPDSNEFSPADVRTTNSVGTGYLGTPSGRFKVLQPNENVGTDLGSLPPCRCYVNP